MILVTELVRQRLIEVRERSGLKPGEFSDTLGVSASYISYLEKGIKAGQPVKVSATFLMAVCYRFGVDYQWLRGKSSEMHTTIEGLAVDKMWMCSKCKITGSELRLVSPSPQHR